MPEDSSSFLDFISHAAILGRVFPARNPGLGVGPARRADECNSFP
jgi:hypothetical protein